MNRLLGALVVVLLVFPSSFVWGSQHGDHRNFAGRHYLWAEPEMEGTWPTIVALHGVNGWANQFARVNQLSQRGPAAGFAVAQVDAVGPVPRLGQGWNAGHCCGYGFAQGIDDVAWLVEFSKHLGPEPVFFVGFSNGGMMVHRLAAERPDAVAGFSVYAGSIGSNGQRIQEPTSPVPALLMHGDADHIVPLDGGLGQVPDWPFAPFNESVAFWHEAGAHVEFHVVPGADHLWPGGRNNPFGRTPSQALDATGLSLDFFQRILDGRISPDDGST